MLLSACIENAACVAVLKHGLAWTAGCRLADSGYCATKPRPIEFVLARRFADTTAEADVSETLSEE